MYHFVVKQIVRESFRRLSQGNYQAAINLMAEQCHYRFIGRHALGGHRRSRALIAKWFKAVDILTVDDSQAFGSLLNDLAQNFGVTEAAAASIEG
jgi:ketosteroid isomerase-like protein